MFSYVHKKGEVKSYDYLLIEHELYEMKLKIENPNIDHIEAHRLATQKYNYQGECDKYYGNLNGIEKTGNKLEVTYFPEGYATDRGKIEYDIATKKVISCKHCKRDRESFLKTYYKKAKRALDKCANENEFPPKIEIMWY